MAVTKAKKTGTIKSYQTHKTDTGSCEVQIALLTERINDLTSHLKTNEKDRHSRVGLIKMVERRKKLLMYLAKMDQKQYATLIEKLNIRK